LSGRGLCDELITRPEESYQLCCVVVCDLETSRMGAPYTYDISSLRVKQKLFNKTCIVTRTLCFLCIYEHYSVFAVCLFWLSVLFATVNIQIS